MVCLSLRNGWREPEDVAPTADQTFDDAPSPKTTAEHDPKRVLANRGQIADDAGKSCTPDGAISNNKVATCVVNGRGRTICGPKSNASDDADTLRSLASGDTDVRA